MTKHTPGPWKIEEYSGHPHIEVFGKYGDTFQRVCALQDHMGSEGDANARLIAAAPDLLDTLQFIVGLATAGVLSNNLGKQVKLDQIKTLAEIVIAKATKEATP